MDDEWMAIGLLAELPDGKPARVWLEGTDLLVLRRGEQVVVVSDRCTHQGAALHRGALHAAGSLVTIACPAHGSLFSLPDGRVLRGPATSPLPAYQARVTGDSVEIRQHR